MNHPVTGGCIAGLSLASKRIYLDASVRAAEPSAESSQTACETGNQ